MTDDIPLPIETLDALQAQVAEWHARELSASPDRLATAGKVCEEAGELIGAAIKAREVRNDGVDWAQREREEAGDVLIALCAAMWARGWSLAEVVAERWADVGQRRFATATTEERSQAEAPDMRYPEGRPSWLGKYQPWPCGRCRRDVDDADQHECRPAATKEASCE